jgi:hypothetical protein
MKIACGILVGKPEGRDFLRHSGVDDGIRKVGGGLHSSVSG